MSYQGPVLIKEPELRWPIVVLAALITAVIALLVATMHYVASTRSPVGPASSQRLEWKLQPELDRFKPQIAIVQERNVR